MYMCLAGKNNCEQTITLDTHTQKHTLTTERHIHRYIDTLQLNQTL